MTFRSQSSISASKLYRGQFVPGESAATAEAAGVSSARATTAAPARKASALTAGHAVTEDWFWGEGRATLEVRQAIELAAKSDINVLIIGETGTGKELIARTLHAKRRQRLGLNEIEAPYVALNCGAVPEALAESLLFGHERGAFTSARERQHGKFETARSGVLFLDEIQGLSPSVQIKLLRVIQHREFERLGAKAAAAVDCQIVAATNIPLELLVDRQQFRRDLYYRLNVCPVYLPSLRQRKEDLPLIVEGLLKRVCAHYRLGARKLSPAALRLIQDYSWPGNVRELEHVLLYGALRCDDTIEPTQLPGCLTGQLASYLSNGSWDI